MPQVGDIKRAYEIGRKGRYLYTWVICPMCNVGRWHINYRKAGLCKSCNGKILKPKRFAEDNPRWKGGRQNRHGYIVIKLHPNSPFISMASKDRMIMEHRLVMAKKLGRCLLPQEKVHHIDGVRHHNGDANLELISLVNHNILTVLCHKCKLRSEVRRLRKEMQELRMSVQGRLSIE